VFPCSVSVCLFLWTSPIFIRTVVDARAIETTITLYRVGAGGQDPNRNVVSIGRASAIGTGPNGGTTYSQPAAYSAISTVVAPPASLVSIFDYTTTIGSEFVLQCCSELPLTFEPQMFTLRKTGGYTRAWQIHPVLSMSSSKTAHYLTQEIRAIAWRSIGW
jgi:hypothetical protein